MIAFICEFQHLCLNICLSKINNYLILLSRWCEDDGDRNLWIDVKVQYLPCGIAFLLSILSSSILYYIRKDINQLCCYSKLSIFIHILFFLLHVFNMFLSWLYFSYSGRVGFTFPQILTPQQLPIF